MKIKHLCLLLALCLCLTGCSAPAGTSSAVTALPAAAASTEAPAISAENPVTGTPDASAEVPAVTPVSTQRSSAVGFYFDTVVMLTLYGADETLVQDIWTACARYEALLSKTKEGSDVWRINHAQGQPVSVDPETYVLLQEARTITDASGGAFQISLAPVIALWDFTGGTERMPTDEQRLAALSHVDDTALTLGGDNTVTLPEGASIDLGGIAKGYIADRVAEICRGRCYGATISLGGNTYVVGNKPDGSLWRIGIQDPFQSTGASMGVLSLTEGTVVTSGIYERKFEKDGVLYHHILDPHDGLPSASDLASATIVGMNSMEADALATACIVLGSAQALDLLSRCEADGLLITRSGETLTTDGFIGKYSFTLLE